MAADRRDIRNAPPINPPSPVGDDPIGPSGRLDAFRTRRGQAKLVLAGVVLALAAWGAAHLVDPGALAAAFASVSWGWVAASGVAYALGQVASAMVWGVGLQAGGCAGVGRRHVLSAHWIAHGAGELLPAQLGNWARYVAIRRHPAAAASGGWRIAGSMGAWKLVDGAISFLVVMVALLVIPLPASVDGLRWVVGVILGLSVLSALLVWRINPRRRAERLPGRIGNAAMALLDGAALLGRRREALAATGLQLVATAGRVISLAALLQAFGIPPSAALLAFSMLIFSGYLPISPGGVGIREAALVPALVATYGLGTNLALAFSLGVQATATAVSLAGGLLALAVQHFMPAAEELTPLG